MSAKTYNGWTNYETWNVKLWMDNDQWSQQLWTEAAQDCYANARERSHCTRDEAASQELAERLKAHFEDAAQDMLETAKQTCSMFADLIGAALDEVNWDEIAASLMEEVEKETPEDE